MTRTMPHTSQILSSKPDEYESLEEELLDKSTALDNIITIVGDEFAPRVDEIQGMYQGSKQITLVLNRADLFMEEQGDITVQGVTLTGVRLDGKLLTLDIEEKMTPLQRITVIIPKDTLKTKRGQGNREFNQILTVAGETIEFTKNLNSDIDMDNPIVINVNDVGEEYEIHEDLIHLPSVTDYTLTFENNKITIEIGNIIPNRKYEVVLYPGALTTEHNKSPYWSSNFYSIIETVDYNDIEDRIEDYEELIIPTGYYSTTSEMIDLVGFNEFVESGEYLIYDMGYQGFGDSPEMLGISKIINPNIKDIRSVTIIGDTVFLDKMCFRDTYLKIVKIGPEPEIPDEPEEPEEQVLELNSTLEVKGEEVIVDGD